MSFFGRLGSEELKYRVDLVVLRVDTTSSTEPLAVRFTRGTKSTVTPPIAARSGTYDFGGRTLSTTATLYRKRDKWLPKEAEISVVSLKGSERVFGRVVIDLSRYVELGERKVSEEWQLERCVDRRAKISVRLHTKWLKGAAPGGAEDDEVSGQGGAVAAGSQLDEADNSQAHNLDEWIQQEEQEEGAEEEEEEQPTAQPARRQQLTTTGRRGSNGVDALQPASKGRREERKEAPQRGRPQPQKQPTQRGNNRQRTVEQEDEEQQEEEEAEEAHDGEEAEEEVQTVQVRPTRLNGRPAAVITTQQVRQSVTLSAPVRGKSAMGRGPAGRRAAETEEEEEEAGSEVKEESASVAESEEIIEDDEEAVEEEEDDDGRVVKFGGVEARGSTTKSRSPHHTLVQPTKSNLKGGAVIVSTTVPSQATTVRDNITITSTSGSGVSVTPVRSPPLTTSATSAAPSSSPSFSSSLSSDSYAPSSPLPPAALSRRGSDSSSQPNSPKHAAIASELRGIKPITPSQIFSCTLAEAMTLNPRTSSLDVPFVFDRLIVACESGAGGGLAAEGIFRVAADKRAVDALKAHLQEGNYKIESSVESVVVAAVLKAWLMAVAAKQPLVPTQLHPQCLAIGQLDVDKQRAEHHSESEEDADEAVLARPSRPRQMLLQMVPSLPFLSKRLLVRLIALILKTANPPLSVRNRMNVHALAVVFAPSVLTLQPEAGVDGYEMFQRAKYAVRFLEHLIQHSDVLERESALGGASQPIVKAIQPAAATSSSTGSTAAGGVVVGPMTSVAVQSVGGQSAVKPVLSLEAASTGGNIVAASPRTIRAAAAGKASGLPFAAAEPTVALTNTTTAPIKGLSPASSLLSSSSSSSTSNTNAAASRLPPGAVPTIFQQQQRGKSAMAVAPSAIDKALQMTATDDRRRQAQQQMARQRPGQRPVEQEEEEDEEDEAEDEEEEVVEDEDSEFEEAAQQPITQRGASMLRGKSAAAAQSATTGNVLRATPASIRAAAERRGGAMIADSGVVRPQPQPITPGALQQVRRGEEDEEAEEQDGDDLDEQADEDVEEDEQHSEDEVDERESPQLHKQLSSPPHRQSPLPSKTAAARPQQPPPPPSTKPGVPTPASRMRPVAASASSPASHLIAANLNGITDVPTAGRPPPPANSRVQPQQSGVYGNQRGRNLFDDDEGSEQDEQQDEERSESAPRRPSPLPLADSDEDYAGPPVIHMDEQQDVKQPSAPLSIGNIVQASPNTVKAAALKANPAAVAQEEKQLLPPLSQMLAQQQTVTEQQSRLQQQQQQLSEYEAKVADYERRLKEFADREAKRQQEDEQRKKKEADDQGKSADKRAQEANREREIERLRAAKALQTAQAELNNTKKELEAVNTNLTKRTAEVIELKSKLKSAAADSTTADTNPAVMDRSAAKDKQLQELTAKSTALTATIAALQQEKRARDEQEAKRQQDATSLDALKLRISEQDEQLQQQADRLQQLQVELKERDAEIGRLSAALTAAEARAAAAMTSSDRAGDDVEPKDEADDSEYEIYEDDSDETVELKQRVIKLKQLMRRKNQQVVQLKKLTASSSPLTSNTATPASSPRPSPPADSSELQRMLRSSEAKVAAREKEVAEWKVKVEVATRQKAEAVSEANELREELKKRELHATELVAQVKQMTAEKEAERGQKAGGKGKDGKDVSRLLEERKLMEGQLIAMQQQIDAKQTVIDEYEQRLSGLQTTLRGMEDEAHKVRQMNTDIEQKMDQLQHNTEQLQAVSDERDQLQQRIKALEADLTTAQAEQQRLEKEVAGKVHSSPPFTPSTPPSLPRPPPPSAGAVISSVTAQRELSKTKETLDRLKHKYESSRLDWQTRLEAEKHRSTMTQLQINTLQQENGILRQRQIGLEELRDRLTTAATASSSTTHSTPRKRDKQHELSVQTQLVAAQEHCHYLEKQVRDCEAILALARETWAVTAAGIEEDNKRLEGELQAAKAMYDTAVEDKGVEYVQLEVLSKKLSKSERMRETMRKQMSEMEEEQARWKKRLEEAQKLLRDREEECELLKGEVVREGMALKEIAQTNWEMKEWLRMNVKK